MTYIQRAPSFEISIKRQDFSSGTFAPRDIISFPSSRVEYPRDVTKEGVQYPGLLSYNFTETTQDPSGSFSLTIDPSEDAKGASVLDVILPRDLVYISEHGVVRFVGVVSGARYSGEMADKPSRNISVNGYGIGGLISRMGFVLDQYLLPAYTDAKNAAEKLMATLAKKMDAGASVGTLVKDIVTDYMAIQRAVINSSSLGLESVLSGLFDYTSRTDSLKIGYPFALNAYQAGINTIWTILQEVFPPPVHELFGFFDDATGKYSLVARECPFDKEDWDKLPLNKIAPVMLSQHDVGLSDEDVYSAYLGLLPGAAISREQALTFERFRPALVIDNAMWQKYGFKPLYLEFRYFDHGESGTFDAAAMMEKESKRLLAWYQNNDKMYSGTVRFMNYVNEKMGVKYPRIGERLEYLGGQFYIEGSSRSWSYGGPMETTLTVNRGYDYANGKKIANIGQRARLLEREAGN